jgi:hypothetical protein
MKTRLLAALPVSLFLTGLLFALPKGAAAQDQQDPPTRVARLNYVEGSVSYQPSGEQDWVQADLNRPLTTGDNLWADQDSRAELHIGSTAFRMGNQTGISFLNLNDQAVQVQLAQGTLQVNVRRLDSDDAYEIDAPNLAFSILRAGEYRFEADPNGTSTVVIVYAGQGVVTGGGQTFNVTPGQRAVFTGTDQISENVQSMPGPDSFESWARSREDRQEHSASARYLPPDVAGYEDLDDYGSWHSDSEYGSYWVPNNVDADWEPYHEGRWCWVAPWGWTWVDSESWGFTPFHYGRWAIIGSSWGWVPGPVAVVPVYAPALVGFVGGGSFGVAVGFSGGVGVGWFPLGPRDVYVPPYQVSSGYVEAINVSNTRIIDRTTVVNVYNNYTVNHVTNINYTYANNTRAVTVVNRGAFVAGQPVAQSAMRVNAAEIQHPRVVTTAALTPTRTSVVGAVAGARAKPPASIANRKVVTKMTPSPRAEPIGRPRPSTNPNLSPAVLNRSGYSPQLQTVRATAAARAPAKAAEPAPNRPTTPETARPGNPSQPNRPAAAPNEPRPNEPNRPATPPNETRPNETQPNRPFTPPNRPAENPRTNPTPNRPATPAERPRPETRPPSATPPEGQPNRPTEHPRPETKPPAGTPPEERQPSRPAEQPRPQPQERPRTAPPAERPATKPAERPAQPPPKEEKPKEKPKPQPQQPA